MGAFVITGATKGIGRALAERLAKAGKEMVGLARARFHSQVRRTPREGRCPYRMVRRTRLQSR